LHQGFSFENNCYFAHMIDILNSTAIATYLSKLSPQATPLFGHMNAHQMIEHLYISIHMSVGTYEVKLYEDEQRAAAIKRMVIGSTRELPQGFKTPALPDAPLAAIFDNLDVAKQKLFEAILIFEQYYSQNPQAQHMHPTMGLLNKVEWLTMHGKHFTHHFKQFGIA
jgi:hypothetical protein